MRIGKCKNCNHKRKGYISKESVSYCEITGRLINPKTFNPPMNDCPLEKVNG